MYAIYGGLQVSEPASLLCSITPAQVGGFLSSEVLPLLPLPYQREPASVDENLGGKWT